MEREDIMKRVLAVTAVGLLLGTAAYAANVHLKQNRNPTFVDNGLTLEAVGNLTGLGEGDVVIQLTSEDALPTATCTNPSGKTQPPGQNPAPVDVTGLQPIPETEIKNGNLGFDVETDEPVTPVPGAPDCPNSQWTERITDVSFTNATIEVFQDDVLVLTVVCEFSEPTTNGAVPRANVSCTSS